MPVTIKEVLDQAARKIGILAGGGAQLTSDEYADALSTLRMMLDSWSLEDLMIPFHPTEAFALDSGRAFYSMGPGGDWDTIRPEQVLVVRILDAGRTYPVEPTAIGVLQEQTLLSIRRPVRYALNRDGRFVYVEFDAYPEPGTSALVTTLKPFNSTSLDNFDNAYVEDMEPEEVPASGFTLTGIQSAIEFPSGYLQCIVYNLAVHLAAEYGKTASPEVMGIAGNTRRLVKRRNSRSMEARLGLGCAPRRGTYDVRSGP